MPALRTIAVCVDDFGLHEGVNGAVLELAATGTISATSCMVGAPAWSSGLRALRNLATEGRIDVGLHLDFTEHPLQPGSRRSLRGLLLATMARRLDANALRSEIEAQFDAFEAGMGRPPDHVDGHQHVHQFPMVREALLEAIARRYPVSPPWLRSTRRAVPAGHAVSGRFKPWLIERLGGPALDAQARARGWRQNHRLLGVYDFDEAVPGYGIRLGSWLAVAQAHDLLMCHPSTLVVPGDPIGPARRKEYETLSSRAFRAQLDVAGVAIARLGAAR